MNNNQREIEAILALHPEIGVLNGTSVHGKFYVWKPGAAEPTFADHPSKLIEIPTENN